MTGLQCWKKNGRIQSCRHPIIHYPLHLPGYLVYLLLLPSSTGQNSPVLGPMFKKTLLWLSSKGPSLKAKEATPTQSPRPIFLLDLWLSDLGLQNGSIRSSRNLLEMQIFRSQSEPLHQKLWRMGLAVSPIFFFFFFQSHLLTALLGDSACSNLDQTLGSHTRDSSVRWLWAPSRACRGVLRTDVAPMAKSRSWRKAGRQSLNSVGWVVHSHTPSI